MISRKKQILKPPRLKKNDVIGLVCPASTPSSAEKVEKAVRYLEGLGYRTKVGRHVMKQVGYLAGTDDERAEDLNEMFRDKSVRAVIAVRGGYGTPRILTRIDFGALKRDPKILVGYSDLTALQLAVFRKIGLVSFSGPMAGVEMWNAIDPYTEEHFWKLLTSATPVGVLANPADEPTQGKGSGLVKGRLLGGNMSLVASLLTTPYSPDYRGSILVLEDVDEAPHRVDRMFVQFRLGGMLDRISALVLGRFTDCVPSDPKKPSLSIEDVLKEVVASVEVPVLTNFQYGHIPKKLTLPFGLQAVLDASRRTLDVRESAVR
ncbi:MAG TPA: LD-carboxypeptidase [Bacteroidota bacterium]